MLSPSLHTHYRYFTTTTTESAPYISSTFPASLLPLSILQSDVEFTCSLKWPVLRSCQLYPGCDVAGIFRTSSTLITDTNVTTCFPHRNLPYRGFIVGSLSFSSTVLTYRNHCSRFFLIRSPHSGFPNMQRKVVCWLLSRSFGTIGRPLF